MKKLYKIQPVLYTAFTILFSEVILRYSTTGGPLFPFLFFTGVLSLFYSCLIALVTSLFSEKVNFILRTVIYTCTAVLFLVNFFLFRQFKVFYDMKTVFAGAGGVLSGFTDNIKHMFFSADGMFHIFLLFLPAVLFVIFRKKMNCAPSDTDTRFMLGSLCLGLPVFVLIYTLINNSVDRKLRRRDLPHETEAYRDLDYIDPVTLKPVQHEKEIKEIKEIKETNKKPKEEPRSNE